MANYDAFYEIQFTDINGDTALMRVRTALPDTTTFAAAVTGLGALVTDTAALTNAKVTRQSFSVLVNEAQYLVGTSPPNNAEYSSVTDGARLNFADGSGDRMSVTIPAPVEAVFGPNSNVVDSTEADVATFIAQIAATARPAVGGAFNLYKGGIKVGRRARRRVSRLIP